MLEPYDGKLSRTVLRGAWGRKTLGPTRSTACHSYLSPFTLYELTPCPHGRHHFCQLNELGDRFGQVHIHLWVPLTSEF
jgi:hypothetical protein